MKIKVLVALLIVVIIVLAGLLYMKVFMNNETSPENMANENTNVDDTMTVVLDDKQVKKSMYDNNKRTVAVMIDNVGDAVPQTGLNDAMIVYEIIVEGNLTRFMAVYKDPKIENIGPARSARPYFIDYALENDSIFVHYGGSPKALEQVKSLGINNVNGIEVSSKIFWRTNKKAAPHNAIVSVKEMWNYVSSKGYRTITGERNVLKYVTDEVLLENGEIANTVNIPYPSSKVKFVYNEETKRYTRYVGNTIQKDWVTGDELTTKNIIVTFARNYKTDEENGYGRQALENIGSLDGYYITDGKAVKIKCKKTSRAGRTVYQDLNGNEIEINDGNTYIQIVPINTSVSFE